ncbi:hypothetical protein CBS101457_004001 [Exobasidium rhododendri]|nr:hypothetical protein CBS101457_004001 [Exobasidium rhododendri]
MALSLALNWSPPPSSPLFEDSSTLGSIPPGNESSSHSQSASAPTSVLSGQTSTSSPSMDYRHPHQPSSAVNNSGQTTPSSPSGTGGTSPSKSYAAAASKQQQQQPIFQMPTYPNPALTSQHSYSSSSSQTSYGNTLPASSTYSSGMKNSNPATDISEDGRRRRTTSGPQKPSPLNYNDTLSHYPISLAQGTSPFRSGFGLPPGAMAPSSTTHTSLSTNNPAVANGYHPYRRTPKSSDAPTSTATTTTITTSSPPTSFPQGGPPILPPMPGQPPTAAVTMAAPSPRIRSASTTSSGTARESNRTGFTTTGAPSSSAKPISYSSAVSGVSPRGESFSVRQQEQQQEQQQQQGQSGSDRLKNSPQTRPDTSLKSDLNARSDHNSTSNSYTTAAPPFHGRSDSTSSTQSTTDRSQVTTSPASSSGRSAPPIAPNTPPTTATPTSMNNKKPSPLSKGSQQSVENDDAEANNAGSDDENTIRGRSTPTPGEKTKKGFSNKLKKALSFSSLSEIQHAEAAAAVPDRAYGGRSNLPFKQNSSVETNGSSGSARSTSPPRTPDNGVPPLPHSSAASISSRRSTRPPLSSSDAPSSKRSLFNRKFNSSTDNISISSTVSSASVMLRKVGNLGKIARRHSLMGLTNMFNGNSKEQQGKQGLQGDDFGTTNTISPGNVVPADEATLGHNGKKDKVKAKKGSPALASVSHATVELESSQGGVDSSMTPAASYVRQHQLQMKQQAEADRLAKEKQEAAERAAASLRNTKTTDDITESRQKMIEKEKERLKSKRGWRKKLGVGSIGSSSEAKQITGLETMPAEHEAEQARLAQANVGRGTGGYTSGPSVGQAGASLPVGIYAENSHDTTFGQEELEPPHMPGTMEGYESSGDDFETDSLRHWGEGIEKSRESASKIKSVKGILKNTASFKEQPAFNSNDLPLSSSDSFDRPFLGRMRADSYEVPHAITSSGSNFTQKSQISTTPAATDRVDGIPRGSTSEEERRERNTATNFTSSTSVNNVSFGHHSNSSMPALSIMHPSPTGKRSVTAPVSRKRLIFADAHIYHSTWPAHVYDRRGELATCNRLTPLLAQRIKEELNTYKMEEMAVAPSSRIHTHFFV